MTAAGSRLLLLVVALALAGLPADADVLYGADFGVTQLYTIDLTTGAATLVAPTGIVDAAGIAFDDDGTLFALDVDYGSMTLWMIHPATGATAAVGVTGVTAGEGALVYDPAAGVLWSKRNPISGGGPTVDLVSIDPATGIATVIGNMGLTTIESDPSGFELLPDDTILAFDPQSGLADRMLTIDKTTGVATEIGPTTVPPGTSVGGVARDPDTGIYYMSDGFNLHSVDPLTGVATVIGPHGTPLISGLSFGPPPGCIIGADDTSTLFDVQATDGSGSNARPTGVAELAGLAISPSGTLYATQKTGNAFLYTLDIATGHATAVGALGIEQKEGGLDFDPISGVLYGVNGDAYSYLFTVDLLTGAATLIGPVEDEFGNEIDASALAFDSTGNLYVLKTGTAPELYRVDPSDASVLEMVPIPGFPAGIDTAGMEFDDASGILYVSMGGDLVQVDPVTGGSTVLGPTPANSAIEIVSACSSGPSFASVPAMQAPALALLVATLLAAAAGLLARRSLARSG